MIYRDRKDAGQRLSGLLVHLRSRQPLVLALPRGGVVVGFEIAKSLCAPLDVLIVRKLGSPMNPEFGFGAIASGGAEYIDQQTVSALGLSESQVREIIEFEQRELQRRSMIYRGDLPPPTLAGRCVILVDDGLATGGTARAAVLALKAGGPDRLVLAVPVAPQDTASRLEQEVDEMVCPLRPDGFYAIGQWYESFEQTSDQKVIDLLRESRQWLDGGANS